MLALLCPHNGIWSEPHIRSAPIPPAVGPHRPHPCTGENTNCNRSELTTAVPRKVSATKQKVRNNEPLLLPSLFPHWPIRILFLYAVSTTFRMVLSGRQDQEWFDIFLFGLSAFLMSLQWIHIAFKRKNIFIFKEYTLNVTPSLVSGHWTQWVAVEDRKKKPIYWNRWTLQPRRLPRGHFLNCLFSFLKLGLFSFPPIISIMAFSQGPPLWICLHKKREQMLWTFIQFRELYASLILKLLVGKKQKPTELPVYNSIVTLPVF